MLTGILKLENKMNITKFYAILQKPSGIEQKAVSMAINLTSGSFLYFDKAPCLNDLPAIPDGDFYFPVGSVEFIRDFAEKNGIFIPFFDTYHGANSIFSNYYAMKFFYKRKIIRLESFNGYFYAGCFKTAFGEKIFIKPFICKQFDAVCIDSVDIDCYLNDFKDSGFGDIYISSYVDFYQEFRCYVDKGQVVSICRYDNHDDDDVAIDESFVAIISTMAKDMVCAIDIGVDSKGVWYIVEFNDFWALGAYKGISATDYSRLLKKRWGEIIDLNK